MDDFPHDDVNLIFTEMTHRILMPNRWQNSKRESFLQTIKYMMLTLYRERRLSFGFSRMTATKNSEYTLVKFANIRSMDKGAPANRVENDKNKLEILNRERKQIQNLVFHLIGTYVYPHRRIQHDIDRQKNSVRTCHCGNDNFNEILLKFID